MIGQTVSDQSDSQPELPRVLADRIAIGQTLSDQLQNRFCLGWSQYVFLTGIANIDERRFYEIEALENRWSLRELKRQSYPPRIRDLKTRIRSNLSILS